MAPAPDRVHFDHLEQLRPPPHAQLRSAARALGVDPRGYHAICIAVHAANAWLAFAVVRRIVKSEGTAFAAALLWAVHPVNGESVAWVSQSKTLFASFFALASLELYLTRCTRAGGRAAALAAFVVAFLFKSSVVTLPLVVWSHERLSGRPAGAARRVLGFAAMGLAGLALGVWAQVRGSAVQPELLSAGALLGTVYPTMLPVLWEYFRLFLWPLHLCGFYDVSLRHSFAEGPVLAATVGWASLGLSLKHWGGAQTKFWAVWAAAFLLPATNLLPLPVFYADRYLYLSGLGLSVVLVLGLRSVLQAAGRIWTVVCLLLAVACAILSWLRLDVWRNDQVFWEDVVRRSPGIYKGHNNLGIVYERTGKLQEALREYSTAWVLFPQDRSAQLNYRRLQQRLDLERSAHP